MGFEAIDWSESTWMASNMVLLDQLQKVKDINISHVQSIEYSIR
jgi:hypothetical protein